MPSMPALQRTSLAELVYQRLLSLILSGEFESGSNVNLSDISRELGVSSIPVREAVVRLSCEGLICCETNRRAAVESFTLDSVVETFQLREFLEAGAASLAAERLDRCDLERLIEIDGTLAEINTNADRLDEIFALENEFHTTLVRASGNSLLIRQHRNCINRISAIRVNWRNGGDIAPSLPFADHREILAGLSGRCPDTTASAVRDHIRAAVAKMTLTYQPVAQ